MKDLIKKQDKEFEEKFSNIVIIESWGLELCKCEKEPCECEKIVKQFIAKIRKEIAEAVAEKMIGKELLNNKMSWNDRVITEKELKKSIIENL